MVLERVIGKLVQGMPAIVAFVEDIVISGKNIDEVHEKSCRVVTKIQ